MTPALRKLNLTAHVTFSVAWLGAVAAFLVLSIAGLTSQDAEIVRGSYVAMNLIGQSAIIPLSLAALLTGLVQSLGTHWGLFRHYWVLVKFTLALGATVLLLLHQFTAVAGAARRVSGTRAGTLPEVGRLGTQLVADASVAVVVLLVTTTLSVYKPWGRTRYGQRKRQQERRETAGGTLMSNPPMIANSDQQTTGKNLPLGLKLFLAVVGVIVAIFVVLHLTGGGLGSHGH
jgi:hypothetical protein